MTSSRKKRLARSVKSDPSPSWSFDEFATKAAIERAISMDIPFQLRYRAMMKRLVPWAIAQCFGGTGLPMSRMLRTYFSEFGKRLTRYGPNCFPTSFNVVQAFLSFSDEFWVFGLREERDHLLVSDDYFIWYEKNEMLHKPSILIDAMDEGIIYSYELANDAGGLCLRSEGRTIIVVGVSFVRHGKELSCILVAGENPARPSDRELRDKKLDVSGSRVRRQMAEDSARSSFKTLRC